MSESQSLTKPYAYSFDRSTFRGEFATREQAGEAGFRAAAKRSSLVEAVFVGKRVALDPQADHHAESVVRSMRQRMQAKTGDGSYLSNANEHELADLDAAIAREIAAWIAKNDLAAPARITSISEHPMQAVRAHPADRSSEVQMIGPEE